MLDHNNGSRKPGILIVDDDATVRLLMKETLTENKYTITEAENGIDALDQIKQKQPDLILLDVTMPGINGFDVCTEIRWLYGDTDISIVMVTALEDAGSIEKAYDSGATDFISKPINWDTFPYRIQYLIKARDAIIEIKHHKLHLEQMERISRILTQNKNKDIIMQATMLAMLDIFSADRVILIKPDETMDGCFIVDCEVAGGHYENINNLADPVNNLLEDNIFFQANYSQRPVVSHYDPSGPASTPNTRPKQQMLNALPLRHRKNWYLLIQQNTNQSNWTTSDEETFYRISVRLTAILSRHLLTEKLRHKENLLRQAQEIGHLGNWNWNVKNNRLTWSDEIYRIYGYKPETCLINFDTYFAIEFKEDINRLKLLKNVQNRNSHSYQIDHRIRTSNGNIRWVREQCIGTYDETGKLLEINGIVQDITDAHIKNEQQVHKNKMDAIGQLTSGIAHDFGNLMTVARGNLELLEQSMPQQNEIDNENMDLIKDARSAVNDSVELTKQLLAFSRKKSIAPVFVNIEKTINKFKKLFQNTLGDLIKMSINIDKDLPDILVDPAQFESSLLNIIINARNAMPDGGKIDINAEIVTVEHSPEIIHNADNGPGDECVCLYVKDNGTGMSDEVLEHAIEPFYTTRNNQGTGLGLSMVYGFIKQSGGELIIRSKPEKGTTVYMQFPRYHGKAIKQQKTDRVNFLDNIQATVLIVEDRHSVRKFAVRCLKKPGINVLQAENAALAKKLLKSNNIDLLFTDILMPGNTNGHQLADWASKKYPDLKILLTTAMEKTAIETESDNEQAIRNHSFQLLPKPYSKSELTESVSKLLKPGTLSM